MKVATPRDDPIDVIREEARAVARCFGMAACDEMAAAVVDRVLLRLGGTQCYLPRHSARERHRVQREIAARFDGRNVNTLAQAYGLTPRHVRRILESLGKRSR